MSSDKDQDLSLENLDDLEIGEEVSLDGGNPDESGMELSLDGDEALSLSDEEVSLGESVDATPDVDLNDIALPVEEGLEELSAAAATEVLATPSEEEGLDLDFAMDIDMKDEGVPATDEEDDDEEEGFSLDDEDGEALDLSDSDDEEAEAPAEEQIENMGELDLGFDIGLDASAPADDIPLATQVVAKDQLSADAGDDMDAETKRKMEEIDALMDMDASQVNLVAPDAHLMSEDEGPEANLSFDTSADLDVPLVSEDLDLGNVSLDEEETPKAAPAAKKTSAASASPALAAKKDESEYREVSAAYTADMERTQATIANLRADRQELLDKIAKMEEDKLLTNRHGLNLRAELDERKIELSIIRKKLNEEIVELKDKLKFQDERRMILEEKNRLLQQELDKAGQKNKIDVKKVQMRERELEQKLELLKADAETQIRNRDLKILELKRKIDSMEFDMESISEQEKRSVESRFELEDKLDKAIKTLRTAIATLEDESDRGNALDALKKNIDI